METAGSPHSDRHDATSTSEPLYVKVARHIRRCILEGVLRQGVLITETGVSRFFEISRTPARQALIRLEEEGVIRRRKTRGYAVGTGECEQWLNLTADMLTLASGPGFIVPTKEREHIYDLIENEIIRLSTLSGWRLNAQELAKHYSISRSVIHEALSRMEVSGLVTRHYRSKWTIVPLDEKRLDNIFDVRSWLEPRLLAQAMSKIPKSTLEEVIERHRSTLSRYPAIRGSELDQLELDMHERLLHYSENQVAMVALKSAKAGLISSKHIIASKEVPLEGEDPFIEEHLSILESLYRQNADESGLRLQAHLLKSRQKVQDRLRQFRAAVEIKPQTFAKRIY